MNSTFLGQSNSVRFRLKSRFSRTRNIEIGPGGWNDEELEIKRHDNYEGKFTQFTGELTFYGEDAKYIEYAFKVGGINENVFLTKQSLKEVGGEVKWVTDYIGIADYLTRKTGSNQVTYNFNSDNLAQIIKSHEDDDFELERDQSIDDVQLDPLVKSLVRIEGRTLNSYGESVLITDPPILTEHILNPRQKVVIPGGHKVVAVSKKVSDGPGRFSSADTNLVETTQNNYHYGEYLASLPSNMIFANTLTEQDTNEISIDYDIFLDYVRLGGGPVRTMNIELTVFKYDDFRNIYTIVDTELLGTVTVDNVLRVIDLKGVRKRTLANDEGVAITFSNGLIYGDSRAIEIKLYVHDIKVNVSSFFEASPALPFIFVHQAFDRLMYIITGRKKMFYSKYFGSKDIGYNSDGFGGLIGLISGFWLRAFKNDSSNYKSMQLSLKTLLDSTVAVFNVGAVIEEVGSSQRLRVEDSKFFYQDRVVVKFPYTVIDEEETEDAKKFYSGIEIGYDKGGNYENEAGLDEPNTKTNFTTPIRKVEGKYRQISKIRSDETQMEEQRRKPQFYFPNEDMKGDEDNWFLDLKKADIGSGYLQKEWSDRLEQLPEGVSSPENYKSFLFTPLRMLFRHGWKIRSGMDPYVIKNIKYASSKANSRLRTWFKNETKPYSEDTTDLLVGELTKPKFSPTKVSFKHPVDDEFLRIINGTTRVLIEGEYEDVPNFYFKMEWTNNVGETKRGYLMSVKPRISGEFNFQKCNE